MTIPLRLDDDLVSAAAQVGSIQKRTTRKQIEFWAELGKAVEPLLDITDVYAIIQGLKKINVEPVTSTPVASNDVFNSLERTSSEVLCGESMEMVNCVNSNTRSKFSKYSFCIIKCFKPFF